MTSQAQSAELAKATRATRALAFIAALTALHIVVLLLTPLNLHGDEAQYWAWSRSFDFGYFSKPPLIAWVIAATTSVFGDSEWAVRLFAPLAHGAAAAMLYLLARRMYGPRAGMWAGVGWMLMPGVQLSDVIISTDALLMPLWALALFSLWRLSETGARRWAATLGLALGFGMLAKYAMIYFVLGAGLACLLSARVRAAVLSKAGLTAGALALACITPNLIWNGAHRFATIAHTAADAGLTRRLFHPGELARFVIDQLAVAGPLQFGALVFLLIDAARRRRALTETDRFLFAFTAPALAIIAVEALLVRANANWAATAYPAATVWIAGRFAADRALLLKASAALRSVIALGFAAAIVSPAFADRIGAANALKRARGWNETAALISQHIAALPQRPSAIMVDNRLLYYDLAYYWRAGAPAPLRMWLLEAQPRNSAETSAPMTPQFGARTFIVMNSPAYREFILEDFQAARMTGRASLALGGGRRRDLLFAEGSGFAPAPRDAAFEARVHHRYDTE